MKISTLCPLCPLILLAATSCLAADSALPFKLYGSYLIVINCSLAGTADLTAILDTGVSETVLDWALVKRLSLSVGKTDDTALFLNYPSRVKTVVIPSLGLGPIQVENLVGIAMDLSRSTSELGIRPDLIIGMDVLHRQNFVIDYQGLHIFFGASRPLRWNAKLTGNTRVVTADTVVMGKKLRLQVDTGSSSLLIYGKRFGPVTGSNFADSDATVASVVGSTKAISVDSAELQVGNWHTYHGTVFFSGASSPTGDFAGILGLSTLRPRRVAFDFQQRVLYWE